MRRMKRGSRREFMLRTVGLGVTGAVAGCVAATPTADQGGRTVQPKMEHAPQRRALGPADRIRCGFIGVGDRGSSILQSTLKREDVEVVAICDTYDLWRERASAWCHVERAGIGSYVRFEDMFAKEQLDAVIIAAPDHIHAPAMTAALDGGLDVYIEKPMTLRWEDAMALRDHANETGAVVQVGTQLRSLSMYQQARKLFQSGAIGDLVEVQVHRHFHGARLEEIPPPPEAGPSNVHWDVFLRDTRPYPFDLARYFQWRQFVEYSNGLTGDLMLHHLDMCHFVAGCSMPSRVMSIGGVYHFDDGRTCPDTVSAIVEYPEGFQFNFTSTAVNGRYGLVERYLGSGGSIEIRDMRRLHLYQGDVEKHIESEGLSNDPHLDDFFAAVRSRGKTVAPVDAGCMGASVCSMAVLSQQTGQSVKWNPETAQVVF
jgi:predicted dehydrogenase